MAAHARRSIASRQEPAFDMRPPRRLAIWGGTATMALVMAVVAGYSGNASRPSAAAAAAAPDAAAAPSNVQKSDGRTARLDARAPDIEAATQRLADVVRVLTADRDQLVARVGTLERNLEDITGAIKRQDARQE